MEETPLLHFGRYIGCQWSFIPDGYLRWLLEKAEGLTPGLRAAAVAEQHRRSCPVGLTLEKLESIIAGQQE